MTASRVGWGHFQVTLRSVPGSREQGRRLWPLKCVQGPSQPAKPALALWPWSAVAAAGDTEPAGAPH